MAARMHALGGFAPEKQYEMLSAYQNVINVFPLFREYLTSLLWPVNLNFLHTFHPISSLFEAKGMISIVVIVILAVVAMAAYKKNKIFVFGLLLLIIPLLPAFYIKGISGKPFAERYLYLPSVGFVFLLAIFLSWAKEKLPSSVISITIAFMVIVGLYTVGTITRNNVWKDNFTLWSDTAKKSPDSADAHDDLGVAYALKGQMDMAIEELQTASRLSPNFVEAHNNLDNAYALKGLLDMAIAEFKTVIHLEPGYVKAHYNLGVSYSFKDQLDMAMAGFQTALRLNPDYVKAAEAHYNLARIYLKKGHADMAQKGIEMALNIRPDLYEARQLLNDIHPKQH